jgi:TetR/AcrR family transcriptional repressor of mexCD-oprJ operon
VIVSPHHPVRSDAARNQGAIVDATIATLAHRPRASVADIARAAGVSRGTLYRHFSTRRVLLAATVRKLIGQLDGRFRHVDPARPADQSLDELVATSWWILGLVSGMLTAARFGATPAELRRLRDEPRARVEELLRRGRLAGTFRTDQDLGWQTTCWFAIVEAGVTRMRADAQPRPEAAAEMIATIRAVLAAEP